MSEPLRTVRLCVTDRFGHEHLPARREEILTLEELARLGAVFARLGATTVWLTGGNPLVRRNVGYLVELLSQVPGLKVLLQPAAAKTRPAGAHVSSDGRLFASRDSGFEVDLRSALRGGASDDELAQLVRIVLHARSSDGFSPEPAPEPAAAAPA